MNSIFIKHFPAAHLNPIPQTAHSFPFIDQKELVPPRLNYVILKNHQSSYESGTFLVQVANLNSPNLPSSQSNTFPLLHAPIQYKHIHFPVGNIVQYHNVTSRQRNNLPVECIDVRKRKEMKIVNTKYSHVATSGMRTQSPNASNSQNEARKMKKTRTMYKESDNYVKKEKKEKFPKVLYQLLEDATNNGNEDIVCFLPHGYSFVVKDIEKFETIVMPTYFKMSEWKSFRRQINLYDFTRVAYGPDRGSYYHKSFVRGKPELLDDMKRSKLKGDRSKNLPDYKAPKSPNFYLESEEEVG